MRIRFSQILTVLLCILAIAVFVYLKDNKKLVIPQAKLTSHSVLKEEISSEAVKLQEAFVQVAKSIKPAVVNIQTIQMIEYPKYEFFFGDPFEEFFRDFFGEEYKPRRPKKKYYRYRQEGGGSGVIIDPEGYVLTNEHVIRKAEEIKVTVNTDGKDETFKGKVIGKDARSDLAIVKIQSSKKFLSAPLGDSDKIRVGEWVIAIGSPFGLEQTVTNGIISAVRQSVVVEGREYRDFIQTDAAINRGNSGGPLCNIRGEVIGINTAIYAPTGVFSGIGFAIPINRAKEILSDLIHKGKVVRGWLGVEIKPIDTAIQKQFNLPDKNGALINNVLENSPAAIAGLKRGDVIVEFDNKKISSPIELQSVVAKTGPKKKVKVKVIRDSKPKIVDLVTGEMPEEVTEGKIESLEAKPEGKTSTWLGMKVTEVTGSLRERYQIPKDEEGVVILEIDPSEKAAEMDLQEGDLIKSINRIETKNILEFKTATKKVDLKEGVVFDIIRRGRAIYLSYSSTE
ncbi:MAG: Do family serine endopeptidase [Elusimicrobiota bacterium]|nr:Do family serine endopeptidase [Elusimicrobiota bacterium]